MQNGYSLKIAYEKVLKQFLIKIELGSCLPETGKKVTVDKTDQDV